MSFTVRNVLAGATLLGAVGGVLGGFAFLRRQSLLGDALAHATLPGVCLAFLLTGSKAPLVLFTGALIAGLIGALAILGVVRGSRIKEDAAIGTVLSVFFGFGIVLLSRVQRSPAGNQSGLDKFLFGQAATLVESDVALMALTGGLALGTVLLLYKEFKLVTFDRGFAASLGLPTIRLDVALTLLLVMVVVIGLQTVGVVLVVATLVTPAAAARQWTDSLGRMLLLSGLLGAGAGAVGAWVSASAPRVPTGPVIVLAGAAALLVSLFLAPRRGLLWSYWRERRLAARIRRENLLKDLYRYGERLGGDFAAPVPLIHLRGVRGQGLGELRGATARLARESLVERIGDALRLTGGGVERAASVVRKHRLWELYLTRRLALPLDHVHRDAETMEHALDDGAEARLDEILGYPPTDPHGQPIPRPGGRA
ncbi:MAG: iron chelate uptake ABC transporter family permease subunit [Thermoanaerobaculia bacterium]|nr:iron chelate uptake ABC transporter family permease subunit [Thermoanaerobaculia bacterium]